jgi:hypothetical protein
VGFIDDYSRRRLIVYEFRYVPLFWFCAGKRDLQFITKMLE